MNSYEPPPPIKIVDGKGGVLQVIHSVLIPRVGEYVQLFSGKQFCVFRVMTVYAPTGNFTMVTVES